MATKGRGQFPLCTYSETCLKWPLKVATQDRLSLNAGRKHCRMLQGEHSAMLSTFIKLPFVTKNFVLSIFEWLLYTGFTVYMKLKKSLKPMARNENNLAEMFNKHNSMPQVKNLSKIS